MPFDEFVPIEVLREERRDAIRQTLRQITREELQKIVSENLSDFEGDPLQTRFLAIIQERPDGSFYEGVTNEGAIVLYSREEDEGLWVLPQVGMGSLPDEAKRQVREAIGFSGSRENTLLAANEPISKTQNPETESKSIMKTLSIVGALMLAALSSSCSRGTVQQAPPPPEVLVATVAEQDVPVIHEGVATLEGFITANINAQVQGYLISRDYKEGNQVKEGDLLFQIDPRPFQAALDQARGNLAVAQSNQIKADADVKRAMKLFDELVISAQERDSFVNAASSTKANVQAAQAAVRQAEVNLGYTKITAPINGIVGIASAHVGDLVGPGTGSLTSISQIDPIKATVNLGEQSFNEFITDHPDPDDREQYLRALSFELILGNGSVHAQKGTFYAEDRSIDPKTGAIRMELTFSNPGNRLRPGQFGKVRSMIKVAERRARHSAGSSGRAARWTDGRRCGSRQQSNHASGQDGGTHRRYVAGNRRPKTGRKSCRPGNHEGAPGHSSQSQRLDRTTGTAGV